MTRARRKILEAARGEIGVISQPYMPGFEGVTWKRNAAWLVSRGFITPNAHGDWYITDAGRAAIAEPSAGKEE